jgi:hypothetical protein
MSGQIVGRALERHFDAIRRAELDRLRRKFSDLNPRDRQSAESIISEVIAALARRPAAALADADQLETLDAIVQLFGLEVTAGSPSSSEA